MSIRDISDATRVGFYDFEELRPKVMNTLSANEKLQIEASLSALASSSFTRLEKDSLRIYFEMLIKRNESLSYGMEQILVDLDEIQKIKLMLIKDGQYFPKENLIGIMGKDPWFYYVADAVQFLDSKRYGRHARILYSGGTGIAVVIKVKSEDKFLLNLMYRHSIRGYSLEIPGRITREGELLRDSIAGCIKIDTNLDEDRISKIIYLGQYVSDRGILGETVPLIYVEIDGSINPDTLIAGECVQKHILMKFSEWKNCSTMGYFVYNKTVYTCSDGYSRSILYLMEQKGIEKI